MKQVERGIIRGFVGMPMSGIAELVVTPVPVKGKIKQDKVMLIPCENGQTVRSLDACFGNVIAPGHSVNPEGNHINKEIYFSVDESGLLIAFTPVEDACPELVEAWRKEI